MSQLCQFNYVQSQFNIPAQNLGTQMRIQLSSQDKSLDKIVIKVFAWTLVSELKKMIIDLIQVDDGNNKLIQIFFKNIELKLDQKTLYDYGIINGSVLQVELNKIFDKNDMGNINGYRIFSRSNKDTAKLLKQTQEVIRNGKAPLLVSQGTSGSYFIQNQNGKKIAIFKPYDEEVYAPNNPRGYEGSLGSDGICKGILSGECATREVAAYLLDSQSKNYHQIPITTYIQFYHQSFSSTSRIAKHGSLQQFIQNEGIIGDFGSSRFSVQQVHKIGILDLRILNCDRNDGNIIVKMKQKLLELIPIDHGLSFPDNLQIYEDSLIWMSYGQSKKPFSKQELEFIQSINPVRDYQILSHALGFRQICLRNFRLSEIFLKIAARSQATLYDIGKLMYRSEQDEGNSSKRRSKFEELILQAQNLYLNVIENQKQEINVIQQSDEQEDEYDGSLQTNDSMKNLFLRKKISLPALKKRTTSYHEKKNEQRKKREGINGIKKQVWSKYHNQEWKQLFYHYFEQLVQTYFTDKMHTKSQYSQKNIKVSL